MQQQTENDSHPETEEEYQNRIAVGTEYRRYLLELLKLNSEKIDHLILTLSSGLLGVSLAFVKDVVPIGFFMALPWLIISWIMFGIAIMCTLASYFASQFAIECDYGHNEKINMKGEAEHTRNEFWDRATRNLTNASAIVFVLGVFATIYVVSINLYQENTRMQKEKV